MTARRCTICQEVGHTKRRHAGEAPIDVPASGQADLLGALQLSVDAAMARRPSEVAREALAAARERSAGGVGATERRVAELMAITAEEVRKTAAQVLAVYGVDGERKDTGAPATSASDCRCLGSGPDEVHPIGAPQCMHPGGLEEFMPTEPDPGMSYQSLSELDCPQVAGEPVAYSEGGVNLALSGAEFSAALDDPGPPAAGAVCNCADDGDWHPVGSGGCVLAEEAFRPVEAAECQPYDQLGEEVGLAALLDQLGEQGPQYAPWRTPAGPDGPKLITLPGVYELDANEYHDPAVTGDWLSNSDARQLIDPGCPAQFRYDKDNRVHKISEAFSVGHAVHARILGKGESIAVRPPEFDSWRTNAAKAWRAEQEAAGRSVILPEHAAAVEAMAVAVHEHERAHELLSQPGRPEVGLFWVCPDTGVRRRALVDYLPAVTDSLGVMRPVDIKSAEEVAPNEAMERKLYDHAWHRQGTTIADGIIALGLAFDVDFHFIVQSKKAPHLVTIVRLDAEAQRIGRIENRRALLVYRECLESGVWPGFAEEPVTLSVPQWIARQYEDEMVVR